ncbi:MAG: HAMP domain-containing histidine kinase [Bacteroidales bacterium]|nr:HAMP domain-containing histidine kinase [Bacteroidales bacterium]
MLSRSLSLSIIAILFLLVLQGVWLFRIIDNEMNNFRSGTEKILYEAINSELYSRVVILEEKDNFRVTFSNNTLVDPEKKSEPSQSIDFKSDETLTGISMEDILQEAYKNSFPLNLDTLTAHFSHLMDKAGKASSFKLNYTSSDTSYNRYFDLGRKGRFPLISSSFLISKPLSLSKDLQVDAEIFYPRSVYKGDLLTILSISLALTIFILMSIIMQARMLMKQLSIARFKENITHFLTHELRSPLQSSITNLEVGEMADKQSSSYFLGKAKEQLYFLNGLIEKILDINKFEKKSNPLNKSAFGLYEAIEPHIARHNLSTIKKISISFSEQKQGLTVFGDKLHISNSIGNLIDNAVKYSGDPAEIEIECGVRDKYYYVSVKDNGLGIPREEQGKIFEKFYRVNRKEHSQKGKGFGLGLNYVMWVVKSHKGKIELESEPGKGSCFTLLFNNRDHGKENSSG